MSYGGFGGGPSTVLALLSAHAISLCGVFLRHGMHPHNFDLSSFSLASILFDDLQQNIRSIHARHRPGWGVVSTVRGGLVLDFNFFSCLKIKIIFNKKK